MNASIHAFPTVTDVLDEVARGLERALHARFPQLAPRLRVVVERTYGGVDVSLRTLALTDREAAMAHTYLAGITGTTAAPSAPSTIEGVLAVAPAAHDAAGPRHMRRPARPRVFESVDAVPAALRAGHGSVVRLAEHRRAS